MSQDPIGLAGGNPTLYAYVGDVAREIDPFGLDSTTVGRWMSATELDLMKSSGYVVESVTGANHVTNPADPTAFFRQAQNGTVYAQFDVHSQSLVSTGENRAKIVGPNSLEGRLSKMKGRPIPAMPRAYNMQVLAEKVDGEYLDKTCNLKLRAMDLNKFEEWVQVSLGTEDKDIIKSPNGIEPSSITVDFTNNSLLKRFTVWSTCSYVAEAIEIASERIIFVERKDVDDEEVVRNGFEALHELNSG